ncbi:MAG: hypothetical protein K2N78_10140, partial [Oscillospiraceae bacterium]|nr:hypothetical protein [Oscillospiraceae bacterium]
MKNHTIAIFLAAYLLFLAAHTGWNGAAPAAVQSIPAPPKEAEPVYQLEPTSAAQSIRAGDREDTGLVRCSYQMLTLSVANIEALSAGKAETARRNAEAFNERMTVLLEEFEDHGRTIIEDARDVYGA